MVGFAHAALAVGGAYSPGLLHLRVMNPYAITSMKVTGAFGSKGARGRTR